MVWFRFPTALSVELAGGRTVNIPEGLWSVQVSGISARVGIEGGDIELDLEQWDSILREGFALPASA